MEPSKRFPVSCGLSLQAGSRTSKSSEPVLLKNLRKRNRQTRCLDGVVEVKLNRFYAA